MLKLHRPARPLRLEDKNILVHSTDNTRHGEAAFSSHAFRLLNLPPRDIRNAPTITVFKSRLKPKLFADTFY